MNILNPRHGSLYFQYQKLIQTRDNFSVKLSERYLSEKFSSSKWLYSKNLLGHTGCVNALAFSNNGGDFLVSGGDDRRILIWKVGEAFFGKILPQCLKQQHKSNIFCVTFDNKNKHIISAGNDEDVLYHNFETLKVVLRLDAPAETNEICTHPEDDHVFIVAESSPGYVSLFDVRTPSEQVKIASSFEEKPNFYSAQFNPVNSRMIATGSNRNCVQLWDIRCPERCLRHFDEGCSDSCSIAMSVTFDRTGHYVAAVRKSLPPVVYHIDRDYSLMEFFDEGYCNSITRKSICFAGRKDEFLVTGSDNFDIYVWKMAKLGKDYPVSAKVRHSSFVLKGHRSIVNQVCFNPSTAMICSAGVEKVIKMWSPFPMVDGIRGDVAIKKRKLYSDEDFHLLSDEVDPDLMNEDQQMLAMFDQFIRSEYSMSDFYEDNENDNDSSSSSNEVNVSITSDEVQDENSECSEDNSSGVGLERLREIISLQQHVTNASTNLARRIAEVRRDCLREENET